MTVATAEKNPMYDSGFPKKVIRHKHNLTLNERLKAARNRKGLSAAAVVKKLEKQGVTIGHSTLQGYEADENSLNHRYPSLPVLMQLSIFYGCSLDYLFGITDRFRPNDGKQVEDIKDRLEGRGQIMYNGRKLNKRQREFLVAHLDAVIAEMF
jgi:transcriptional regulator with XRE-family HTH domain